MQLARPRPIMWLASVLLLGACGADGSDGTGSEERRVSATSYVTDVCGAFTTWRNEVVSLSEELQSSQEPSSIEAAKNSAVSFFDDVVEATDRMVSDVEGAGVPEVARGDAAAREALSVLRGVRETLVGARERVEALSTDDPEAFSAELRTIGGDLESSFDDIGSTLEVPELGDVADDVPACRSMAA